MIHTPVSLTVCQRLKIVPLVIATSHLPPRRTIAFTRRSTAQRLSISSQYIGGLAQRRAIIVERLVGLSERNVREVGPVLFELPHKVLGLRCFAPEAVVPVVVKPCAKLNENGKVRVAPSSLDCGRPVLIGSALMSHLRCCPKAKLTSPNAFLRLQAFPNLTFSRMRLLPKPGGGHALLPCSGKARQATARVVASPRSKIVSDDPPDIALEGAAGVA